MKIVVAPDSFKGGPDARRVANALAAGWHHERPADEMVLLPMADGGEGTLDALSTGVPRATRRRVAGVTGPDGRSVPGVYLQLPDGTAIVELAAVSGLPMMVDLNPLGATSRGVGEVIGAAMLTGANRVVLGVGGSASTDGGTGALAALGARFLDADQAAIPDGGGTLGRLASVDLSRLRLPPARGMEILTDVDSPLLGPRGAAAVFGPQKGAGDHEIDILERGLTALSSLLGGDPHQPGSGAAGGVAYGFAAAWGARLRLGSVAVACELSLAEHLADADLLVSGEGQFDITSLQGKVVGTVLGLAATACVPTAVVAGVVADEFRVSDQVRHLVSLTQLAGSAERSMAEPEHYLELAGRQVARHWNLVHPPT